MPRPKSSVPRLLIHRPSGQARVRINGKDLYLGPAASPEAHERYRRFVAEFLTTGAVGVDAGSQTGPKIGVSVNELILAYVQFAEGYYLKNGKQTSEVATIKDTLRFFRQHYGMTVAAEFGPLRLKACREAMVERGWCRKAINQRIGRIKRMFKWGVENELLPPSVFHGLAAVAGLRYGRTAARESDPIKPIADAEVNATLRHLGRQVVAMVQFQSLTGCRPGEVCQLRPIDIDRDGDVWIYAPKEHKTAHHGHSRLIYIGPRAQEVLRPWLDNRPSDAYCFSPDEAEAERRAARHARRVTPMSCGNKPGSNVKKNPQARPGDFYITVSYRAAITRACKKAGIKPWAPNRLRHSRATEVRKAFGLEAAKAVLGHSDVETTQVYAERDAELGRRVALEMG